MDVAVSAFVTLSLEIENVLVAQREGAVLLTVTYMLRMLHCELCDCGRMLPLLLLLWLGLP